MTQEEFNSIKYSPKAFSMPFASNDPNTMDIEQTEVSADTVNIQTGIPAVFSSPGTYIERTAVNGIFNAISRDGFFNQVGGYRTFDKSVSDVIGGYPKGAILKYLNMGILYDVISLKDNNKFNFIENGVDNINWSYVSAGSSLVPDWNNKTELALISQIGQSLSNIGGIITMPFDGFIKINTNSISAQIPQTTIPIVYGFSSQNQPLQAHVTIISASAISMAQYRICALIADSSAESLDIVGGTPTKGTLFTMASSGGDNLSDQPIPVPKGYKIQLFGVQNYTSQWPVVESRYLGGVQVSGVETLSGTFKCSFSLNAYPVMNAG